MIVLCCVSFGLLCRLTKYIVVDTALGPTLTVGMPEIGPGDSQVLFSPSYQCRSTEVRSQDCSSHAPGSTVGSMEAAQTVVWPNPHIYMLKEPTAATARLRLISAARALVVFSDVLQ